MLIRMCYNEEPVLLEIPPVLCPVLPPPLPQGDCTLCCVPWRVVVSTWIPVLTKRQSPACVRRSGISTSNNVWLGCSLPASDVSLRDCKYDWYSTDTSVISTSVPLVNITPRNGTVFQLVMTMGILPQLSGPCSELAESSPHCIFRRVRKIAKSGY
jgi:hypothetical protein